MKDEDKNNDGDQTETSADETQNDQENKDEKGDDQGEDYHAKELERLQGDDKSGGSKYTPLEKAQHAARKIADEIKKYGGDPGEVFGGKKPDGEGKKDDKGGDEDIDVRVARLVDEKLNSFQSGFVSQQAQGMIRSVSKSDSEAALIQYHLENTIRLSGNMEEDVKRAYLMANHGKILQNVELFKQNLGKKTQKPSDPGQKSARGKQPTVAQKALMDRRGLKWDADKGEIYSPSKRAFQERTTRTKR